MATLNPAATQHLPSFITAPGETDVLMVVMGIILAVAILMFGILFLRLHSLPERLAHRTQKLQLEIVAVLCLISLFTHMHIFWIAGLLLALIELPDFGTSLNRIATSAEKMAGIESDADIAVPQETPHVAVPVSAAVRSGQSKGADGISGGVAAATAVSSRQEINPMTKRG